MTRLEMTVAQAGAVFSQIDPWWTEKSFGQVAMKWMASAKTHLSSPWRGQKFVEVYFRIDAPVSKNVKFSIYLDRAGIFLCIAVLYQIQSSHLEVALCKMNEYWDKRIACWETQREPKEIRIISTPSTRKRRDPLQNSHRRAKRSTIYLTKLVAEINKTDRLEADDFERWCDCSDFNHR